MDNTVVLTVPEIVAVTRGAGTRAETISARLGIDEIPEEVARAGISSLYARGLLELDDAAPRPSAIVVAAIGIVGEASSSLRMASIGPNGAGVAHLHCTDEGAVLVSPVGLGCLEFTFVDVSGGLEAIVRTAGEAALDTDDKVFLLSLIDGGSETTVAVRRVAGAWELSNSESGEFVAIGDDVAWTTVVERLGR